MKIGLLVVVGLTIIARESRGQDVTLTSPSNFRSIVSAPGSFNLVPTYYVADAGAVIDNNSGIPYYGNNLVAGGAFTINARTDIETPGLFIFENLGAQSGNLPNASGSMNVQIMSLQHSGVQAQGMLTFMTATGDNWQSIGGDAAGTQLGEVAFFGSSTHGLVQTETASIWGYLDQQCTDTGNPPVESNTSCGTNLLFRTTPDGQGTQRTVAVLAHDGALWLGNFGPSALPTPFPSVAGKSTGAGAIVLGNSYGTTAAIPNAVVLKNEGGQLFVRLPGSGGEQPIVVQNGGITPNHHVCWQSFGVVGDCGN